MRALIYKGLEGVGFTGVNPDKGTKTIDSKGRIIRDCGKEFTGVNPDKGTKTSPPFWNRLSQNVYRS